MGSDEKNHKISYVTLYVIEEASKRTEELSKEALDILNGLEQKNEFLCLLVESLVSRRK